MSYHFLLSTTTTSTTTAATCRVYCEGLLLWCLRTFSVSPASLLASSSYSARSLNKHTWHFFFFFAYLFTSGWLMFEMLPLFTLFSIWVDILLNRYLIKITKMLQLFWAKVVYKLKYEFGLDLEFVLISSIVGTHNRSIIHTMHVEYCR